LAPITLIQQAGHSAKISISVDQRTDQVDYTGLAAELAVTCALTEIAAQFNGSAEAAIRLSFSVKQSRICKMAFR
jgi:hypothetical protein